MQEPVYTPKKEYEFIQTICREDQTYYIRKCPNCGKDVFHNSKLGAKNSHLQNRKCRLCAEQCKSQPSDVEKLNRSKNLSISMIKMRKHTPPWNKGLTAETSAVVKSIRSKSVGRKHSNKTKNIIKECSIQNWKKISDNYWTSQQLEIQRNFRIYRNRVTSLTRKVEHLVEGFDRSKRGKAGTEGAYQIDHIISVEYGFSHGIPPEEISKLSNLRFITWEENLKKRHQYAQKNKI